MDIIYIANQRIPTEKAHGIQIIKMCEAFANQGAKIKLIIPTRKNENFQCVDIFDYYEVKKNFKIKKIFTPDPVWLIKLPQGIYIKVQATFFIISLFFYFLIHLRSDTRKTALLYTRDEYLFPLLQRFSKHTVWEGHNLPSRKKFYARFWKRCQKIIVLTKELKQEVTSLGISRDKILVAPDGVDLDKFKNHISKNKMKEKLLLPTDKKIIMYTGHLYNWKGTDVLLQAARLFQQKNKSYYPSALFVFIGGTTSDISKFKQQAVGLDNVKILGYKPPSEIPAYLKFADVLVLPNSAKHKISRFTSPLKLFEYMAAGVPIVAADLLSIREILSEKNAILVEPDNADSLANGIQKALEDEELSAKIARAAKEDTKEFTWDKRAKRILDVSYD